MPSTRPTTPANGPQDRLRLRPGPSCSGIHSFKRKRPLIVPRRDDRRVRHAWPLSSVKATSKVQQFDPGARISLRTSKPTTTRSAPQHARLAHPVQAFETCCPAKQSRLARAPSNSLSPLKCLATDVAAKVDALGVTTRPQRLATERGLLAHVHFDLGPELSRDRSRLGRRHLHRRSGAPRRNALSDRRLSRRLDEFSGDRRFPHRRLDRHLVKPPRAIGLGISSARDCDRSIPQPIGHHPPRCFLEKVRRVSLNERNEDALQHRKTEAI
jgi:hypothetical protein